MDPQARIGKFPLAVVAFGLLQMLWWGGCGILIPLATSMIADLSQLKRLKTGEVTEGRYAAGFSFFMKVANSFGMLVVGYRHRYSTLCDVESRFNASKGTQLYNLQSE